MADRGLSDELWPLVEAAAMVALWLGGKRARTQMPYLTLLSHPDPQGWTQWEAREQRAHEGMVCNVPLPQAQQAEGVTNQFCVMITWSGSVTSTDSQAAPGRFQFRRPRMSPEKLGLYRALGCFGCPARMESPFSRTVMHLWMSVIIWISLLVVHWIVVPCSKLAMKFIYPFIPQALCLISLCFDFLIWNAGIITVLSLRVITRTAWNNMYKP